VHLPIGRKLANSDQSGLSNVREHGITRGGLYGFFVKGQALTSTFDNIPASTDSLEESAIKNPPPTSASTTNSDDESTKSLNPSESSTRMGRPRQNGGRMKRNTNLVNGANSMPLGKNNRMAALQGGDNKRKRSEEPAEVPVQLEKKSKGPNGVAVKPTYKPYQKVDVVAAPVNVPVNEKRHKKERKEEAAPEPTSEPIKEKIHKKVKKLEAVVEPVGKVSAKEKKLKREKKLDTVPEMVIKSVKEKKKSKEVELVEKESSSDSSESSDLDSETGLSSNSDSDSDSGLDSDMDSDLDLDSDTYTLDLNVEDSTDDELYAAVKPARDTTAMPANVIKVVDGIHIPAPEPLVREKKRKIPAKVIREERKQAREEEARRNTIAKKKKAIEEGTFDFAADERRKKERQVDRIVRSEIIRRENQGEFGPKLPHPSTLLKIEKEIARDLKKQGLEGDEEAEKKAMHARLIVNTPYR
jgi:hypothetical protein